MLFQELQIANKTLRNRIVMSSMCMYSASDDGKITPWHVAHYVTRAMGGVGLVMSEAAAVSPAGRISARDLGIWDDAQIPMLRELASQIHDCGAHFGVQLAHAGRKSEIQESAIAPSPLAFSNKFKTPMQMSLADIEQLRADFSAAIDRAISANIDVIEIHAAHGYLLNQFLSPLTNKRDDAYGGSFAARNKLLLEIVTDARARFDGALFVRISADETQDAGNHIEASVQTAELLKELGVDLVDVSSGGVEPLPPKLYPGYQSAYAKEIRQKAGIKTGAVGLIVDDTFASFLLQEGFADLIFLGRELLREPYWAINNAKKRGLNLYPKAYERAYL